MNDGNSHWFGSAQRRRCHVENLDGPTTFALKGRNAEGVEQLIEQAQLHINPASAPEYEH